MASPIVMLNDFSMQLTNAFRANMTNWQMHLVKAPFDLATQPTLADALANECDFSGYAFNPAPGTLQPFYFDSLLNVWAARYQECVFTVSSSPTVGNDVYGFFVVFVAVPDQIWLACNFRQPYSMQAAGDSIRLILTGADATATLTLSVNGQPG